jgi:hypothetical protein
LKENKRVKEEEQEFLSRLDKIDEDDPLPPEIKMRFKEIEEGFAKIRGKAEKLEEMMRRASST